MNQNVQCKPLKNINFNFTNNYKPKSIIMKLPLILSKLTLCKPWKQINDYCNHKRYILFQGLNILESVYSNLK